MIEGVPIWISLLFLITAVATIVLFYYANSKPKLIAVIIVLWSAIHSVLAFNGFYQNTSAFPPRFGLVLLPTTLLIIYGLLPKQQLWFIENRNIKISTFLHSIRVPVEIVLFQLFVYEQVPKLMTFEGRNFDILIGITAPIIGWLFLKHLINKKVLLVCNVIGLAFIFFIFFNGLLSAELPFQQFGFEQPNRAVSYFPFVLLPATIVPIVIFTHITDLIKLKKEME